MMRMFDCLFNCLLVEHSAQVGKRKLFVCLKTSTKEQNSERTVCSIQYDRIRNEMLARRDSLIFVAPFQRIVNSMCICTCAV